MNEEVFELERVRLFAADGCQQENTHTHTHTAPQSETGIRAGRARTLIFLNNRNLISTLQLFDFPDNNVDVG